MTFGEGNAWCFLQRLSRRLNPVGGPRTVRGIGIAVRGIVHHGSILGIQVVALGPNTAPRSAAHGDEVGNDKQQAAAPPGQNNGQDEHVTVHLVVFEEPVDSVGKVPRRADQVEKTGDEVESRGLRGGWHVSQPGSGSSGAEATLTVLRGEAFLRIQV
jgi:hypothetical protein